MLGCYYLPIYVYGGLVIEWKDEHIRRMAVHWCQGIKTGTAYRHENSNMVSHEGVNIAKLLLCDCAYKLTDFFEVIFHRSFLRL